MNKSKWIKIGECGVDSGQIILVDPCYVLPQEGEAEGYNYSKLTKRWEKGDWKEHCFEEVFSGVAGTGVVVSSGIGDGCYPVYVKMVEDEVMGKRVAEVKVVFL